MFSDQNLLKIEKFIIFSIFVIIIFYCLFLFVFSKEINNNNIFNNNKSLTSTKYTNSLAGNLNDIIVFK